MAVRDEGRGPCVVLIHALGCDLSLWDAQAQCLAKHHRVLRYDLRGHGESRASALPFTFDDLSADLEALLVERGVERAHLVGLSMGGVIARQLALKAPHRIASLVLCSTMFELPPNAEAVWEARAARVRQYGIQAIAEETVRHWFSSAALARPSPALAKVREALLRTSPHAYLAVCDAVPRLAFFRRQASIEAPVLVLAGELDPGRATQSPEALARAIPGARLHLFPGAGHFPNLESPEEFNRVLLDFFSALSRCQ